MLRRYVLLICSVLFASLTLPALAQQAEPPVGRFAYLGAPDAPALNAVLNGQISSFDYQPGEITNYTELTDEMFTLSFIIADDPQENALFDPVEITPEPGRRYTFVVFGSAQDGTLTISLLDETFLLQGIDLENSSAIIVLHTIEGAPPVDVLRNDERIITGLAYNNATAIATVPGDVSDLTVTATDDEDTVVLRFPGATAPPRFSFTLLALAGRYPGELVTDYYVTNPSAYIGPVTEINAGMIALGDSISGELDEGQRDNYTLTLDAPGIVDITMQATGTGFIDPYLRVFTADGTLIALNDELAFDDTDLNAGIIGLELDAGIYTIQAASSEDLILRSDYLLRVAPSE